MPNAKTKRDVQIAAVKSTYWFFKNFCKKTN